MGMNLNEAPQNTWVLILKVKDHRDETQFSEDNPAQRLMELGFMPGEKVLVTRRSSNKSPLVVKVGTSLFALRAFEAAMVHVELSVE